MSVGRIDTPRGELDKLAARVLELDALLGREVADSIRTLELLEKLVGKVAELAERVAELERGRATTILPALVDRLNARVGRLEELLGADNDNHSRSAS